MPKSLTPCARWWAGDAVSGVPPEPRMEARDSEITQQHSQVRRAGGSSEERQGRVGPVFLERSNYRYRRMTDAVRFLPVMGAILWAIPLLWTRGETANSAALLYVFGIWVVLVALAVLLARGLGPAGWSDEPSDPRQAQGTQRARDIQGTQGTQGTRSARGVKSDETPATRGG